MFLIRSLEFSYYNVKWLGMDSKTFLLVKLRLFTLKIRFLIFFLLFAFFLNIEEAIKQLMIALKIWENFTPILYIVQLFLSWTIKRKSQKNFFFQMSRVSVIRSFVFLDRSVRVLFYKNFLDISNFKGPEKKFELRSFHV